MKYYRINPREKSLPQIDDVNSMLKIQERVRDLVDPKAIGAIAFRLIASSFYFDVSGEEKFEDPGSVCTGMSFILILIAI